MRDWTNDLDYGKKAEDMVRLWFGGKLGFDDLLVRCEIKNNWHGIYLCIEEDSVVEDNKKGWVYTSTADNVLFVDLKNEQGILINMDELKKVYTEIKDKYELKTQDTTRNERTWHSTHREIPMNKFCYCFIRYSGRNE